MMQTGDMAGYFGPIIVLIVLLLLLALFFAYLLRNNRVGSVMSSLIKGLMVLFVLLAVVLMVVLIWTKPVLVEPALTRLPPVSVAASVPEAVNQTVLDQAAGGKKARMERLKLQGEERVQTQIKKPRLWTPRINPKKKQLSKPTESSDLRNVDQQVEEQEKQGWISGTETHREHCQ